MGFYSCNLDGDCEEDDKGIIANLARCQSRCTPTNYNYQDKTVVYTTLGYDLQQAMELAPAIE